MSGKAVVVTGLRKTYGSIDAVRGIDLEVNRGEVFALLGPNGAGKTTTVEILEGHRRRTAGDVSVLGYDPERREKAFRECIGIVLQETGVERYLSVAEVIELYGGYYPNPLPVDEVVEVVGLGDKRDERVVKLSGGQKRRLDVAVGLAGNPDLLFLDEPTTGFDPSARRAAWDIVRNLKALGKTVFLTTHYMDEAQNLADRVAIIADGRIVAEGTPEQLISADGSVTTVRFTLPQGAVLPEHLSDEAVVVGDSVSIQTNQPTAILHAITGWALAEGHELTDLSAARPNLEDVYLQLTSGAER
ncbi:MAG: ABC transporter ATP-binding protein [Actinomycetota bacterium]